MKQMIVLVGGEKGGSGKTTLAVNLAVLRARAGRSIVLVDTDIQGSASLWAEFRAESGQQPSILCVQKFGRLVHQDTQRLADRFDDIILDAGGRDSHELRAGMLAAHRMLTPIRPGAFDAWALDRMSRALDEAMVLNPDLKPMAVINAASTNPSVRESEEIGDYLQDLKSFHLLDTVVHERIAFRKAVRAGLSVAETGLDIKATAEMEALYGEVFGGENQNAAA